MAGRLLIVDDDVCLSMEIATYLQARGHDVQCASTGHEALKLAYQYHPDLIVLAIMLPDISGIDVCLRLRELSNEPILMLSVLGKEDDIVAGLQAGADDYVAKPVHLKELEARVLALLRRTKWTGQANSTIYDDSPLRIDPQRALAWREGRLVHLTPTESKVLSVLLKHQGNVVSHDELSSEVWGESSPDCIRNLSIYVRYIRRKLEDDPDHPRYIRVKWGIGYKFVPQAQSLS